MTPDPRKVPDDDPLDYRLIDLFAGCGGLTAGFRQAGFRPVLAVESDPIAASTYVANFGAGHVRNQALETVADDDLPSADVVVGGPPCQGFSGLGRRDPDDDRNQLWREYLRVLRAAQPKVFVIENVDLFSRSAAFELMIKTLGAEMPEYNVAWQVLNAADFGVPQRRRRTVVVGSQIGPPELPQPTHSREPSDGLLPWQTVGDAFHGLALKPNFDVLPASRVELLPGLIVPGVYGEREIHVGRRYSELMLRRFDHVPPGGGRFDLPEALMPPCWRRKKSGTYDVMGRLQWDAPALTIRTEFHKPEKGRYLHPQWDGRERANRTITHAEAARLQTFPTTFRWCGHRLQIARQIGNAVPPRLALAVAHTVRSMLAAAAE